MYTLLKKTYKKTREKVRPLFRKRDRTTKDPGHSTVPVLSNVPLRTQGNRGATECASQPPLSQEGPTLVDPAQPSNNLDVGVNNEPSTGPQAGSQTSPEPTGQSLGPSEESLDRVATGRKLPGCWGLAFEQLDKKNQELIRGLQDSNNTDAKSSWNDVLEFKDHCDRLQQEHLKDASKLDLKLSFNWSKKQRSISFVEILYGLISILGRLEPAAQLATSVDPIHSVWPYLLVKAFFAVSSSPRSQVQLTALQHAENFLTHIN